MTEPDTSETGAASSMSHTELRQTREHLGLTPEEAAALLDLESKKSVYRMESDPANKTARKPAARVVRLYRAYLRMVAAGIWPDGWPERLIEAGQRRREIEEVRT